MAELFEKVFNAQTIHEMLFFNIKSVLIHQNIDELITENESLWKRWSYLAKTKLSSKFPPETDQQVIYEQRAPYYPEFTRIVAITYATVYIDADTNSLKRYMKKIVNDDELVVLSTFVNELYLLSSEGTKSTPQFFPILCGHNVISHDIPHLVKKIIQYRSEFEKGIPLIIKKCLVNKPWESAVIDTVNVWKFNGYDNMPLMLISDYLGLKKTVDLVSLDEVSRTYWDIMQYDEKKALEYVSLQSATQTNLVIQLMNNIRNL